jgi:phosphate transport system substrate-binding protein
VRIQNLVLVLLILTVNCIPKQPGVIIAGSTSVQPFIEKLAEKYMEKHPGISVTVQGGGSSAGIIATLNGTCNIGTSSRYLKTSEKGLTVTTMCLDGIAVVVNKSNPIKDLSFGQVRSIFSGELKNWKEVGGINITIMPVTREEGSGTRGAFEELIMRSSAISDACLVQDSNGAVREIIAITPQGIGYISAGLIDDRIRALSINGVAPTFDNIVSRAYTLVRPFLLLTKGEPTGEVKSFIDYVLSAEGQRVLRQAGLIPVADLRKIEGQDER